MAKNQPKQAGADKVEVTIVRGTYQVSSNEVFDEKGQLVSRDLADIGPGGKVTVDAAEAERLIKAGFVKSPDAVDPEEVQDGTLKITPEDGPQVTVGQVQ